MWSILIDTHKIKTKHLYVDRIDVYLIVYIKKNNKNCDSKKIVKLFLYIRLTCYHLCCYVNAHIQQNENPHKVVFKMLFYFRGFSIDINQKRLAPQIRGHESFKWSLQTYIFSVVIVLCTSVQKHKLYVTRLGVLLGQKSKTLTFYIEKKILKKKVPKNVLPKTFLLIARVKSSWVGF